MVVSDEGILLNSYKYDAFGNLTEQLEVVANTFKYAGYEYDSETGLYYLRSRYYNPKIARFITEDTFNGYYTDPLSLNKYTYCHNNPISYFDPNGTSIFSSIGNFIKDSASAVGKAINNTVSTIVSFVNDKVVKPITEAFAPKPATANPISSSTTSTSGGGSSKTPSNYLIGGGGYYSSSSYSSSKSKAQKNIENAHAKLSATTKGFETNDTTISQGALPKTENRDKIDDGIKLSGITSGFGEVISNGFGRMKVIANGTKIGKLFLKAGLVVGAFDVAYQTYNAFTDEYNEKQNLLNMGLAAGKSIIQNAVSIGFTAGLSALGGMVPVIGPALAIMGFSVGLGLSFVANEWINTIWGKHVEPWKENKLKEYE